MATSGLVMLAYCRLLTIAGLVFACFSSMRLQVLFLGYNVTAVRWRSTQHTALFVLLAAGLHSKWVAENVVCAALVHAVDEW
jgi:hypothetical protein